MREKIIFSEKAVQFSPFRDETEDKVFPIGKEFDELYHWHSLKPLSDDFDRTKQAFKGEALKAKHGNLHCKKFFFIYSTKFVFPDWSMKNE